MRRRWFWAGLLVVLHLVHPAALAAQAGREPLVYYQLLVLSFLSRSACGEDVADWPGDLHAIREILKQDLGYTDRQLSAIEGKANELRLTVPCDSEASRDLHMVTTDEPRLALDWFKSLKSARNTP